MSAGSWWRRLLEQGVPARSVGDWPHDARPIGHLDEDGLVHRTEHWPAAARQLSTLDELDGLREREWAWQYPDLLGSPAPQVTTQVSADESPLLPRPWTGTRPRHRGVWRVLAVDRFTDCYVFRNDLTGARWAVPRGALRAEMLGSWRVPNLEAINAEIELCSSTRWGGGIHHV